MAKFENEGYCPCIWVPKKWDENTDRRLAGLWDLIGPNIVYEKDDLICIERCNKVFSEDIIALDVLKAIVRKNVNADKILIHQYYGGAGNIQCIADIKTLLEEKDAELVLHAGSDFAVVLASADYGLDIYIWDLVISF